MTDRCQYCKTPLGSYGATPCCAWAEIDSLKAHNAALLALLRWIRANTDASALDEIDARIVAVLKGEKP